LVNNGQTNRNFGFISEDATSEIIFLFDWKFGLIDGVSEGAIEEVD